MLIAAGILNSQSWMQDLSQDEADNFYKVQEEFNDYWDGEEYKKGHGWKQFKRWEYFWEQRLFPDGKFPDGIELYNRLVKYKSKKEDSFLSQDIEWVEVGPVNMPQNKLNYHSGGLGRLNCVTIHPEDSDEIWVGAASGGAWFTKDKGQTWQKIDMSGILSIGVSDIAISRSNPEIIYIATGDQNGTHMTNGYSIGIIKSTDGGDTWNSTQFNYTKNQGIVVSRILINPKNSNFVVAGTNRGIRTSIDGGVTWSSPISSGFIRDMEMHPSDSDVIYASTGNYNGSVIYKSNDFGINFEPVQTINSSNRIELAVTPAAPDYVYALASSRTTNGFEGFYVSENKGDSWSKKSSSPNILGIDINGQQEGGQGSYDLALAVSPDDPNEIYTGGIHIWKSENGGINWDPINHWTGSYGYPYVHADQHWLQFDAKTGELYSANDGGLYISKNAGASWEDISNGLPIAQFYKISVYEGYDELVMGGTQDNGTHFKDNGEWFQVHGGDGMECKIHPEDPNIMFATNYYGSLNLSTNGGNDFRFILSRYNVNENGGWVTPFELDTENPNIMYIGYQNLWEVDFDNGNLDKLSNISGGSVVNAIDVSETDNNYIYFTKNNVLYKTTNRGNEWSQIYSAPRTITDIEISASNPDKVWITLSGYTNGVKVYEVIGSDAENISGSLPNFPANTIVEQKNIPGTLFIGTDIGVYTKNAFDDDWVMLDNNLPNVVVAELEINYPRGELYAGTFGRGLWKSAIIECEIEDPEIEIIGKTEFCQGDTLVIRKIGDYDNFEWSNGSKDDSILVTKTGVYYLMVEDNKGCIAASEKINVEVTPVPVLSISLENQGRLCTGDTLKISANFGFDRYEWSNGDTTRAIYTAQPGIYSVKAYTELGCMREFGDIEVYDVPKPEKPSIEQRGDTLFTQDAYAHRWFLNGEFIFDNNKNYHVPKESGKYVVEIINEFGCSNFSDTVDIVTSVNDIYAGDDFRIIPNPNNGTFRIEYDDINVQKIIITDGIGREIYSVSNIYNNYSINLNNISKGIYYLNIFTPSKTYYKKMIIK